MDAVRKIISSCPICGGKLRSLDIAENYTLQPLKMAVAIDYAACGDCTFVMQENPLVGEILEAYYANSPRFRSSEMSKSERMLYTEQAAFMAAGADLRNSRVLDIGADMGKLLDILQSDYGCETYYQEHNLAALSYLKAHGRHCELPDLKGGEQFDWIVLSQVLEHVVDPIPFLKDLRNNLQGFGMLFVEVPNHSFWDDKDYGFSFEHVNYFSVATLNAAMDRAGFVVIGCAVALDPRYFNGRCRIIRAIARRKNDLLISSFPETLREHNKRWMYGRFIAIEKMALMQKNAGQPGLALYGAGELAEQLFIHSKISPDLISAIFDSDSRKHGRDFHGIQIRSPDRIVSINPARIVIMSGAEVDIRQTIAATGYAGSVVDWSEIAPADQ